MQLIIKKDETLEETLVSVHYPEMTKEIEHLIKRIRQTEYKLEGLHNQKTYYITVENILYADCVDGKTFIYTKEGVYESKKNISVLEQELVATDILRISKGSLMNLLHLKGVSPYPNHRLLAILDNGEKLVVSRKYIPLLQQKVRGE